ncbi:immunoglobulin-like domain-containing protein, partial [Staphylococcus aureus]
SAFDKEDGDLTDKIKVDGQIDTSKSGKYQIKYHVTDSDGAIKISTRYIEVK